MLLVLACPDAASPDALVVVDIVDVRTDADINAPVADIIDPEAAIIPADAEFTRPDAQIVSTKVLRTQKASCRSRHHRSRCGEDHYGC